MVAHNRRGSSAWKWWRALGWFRKARNIPDKYVISSFDCLPSNLVSTFILSGVSLHLIFCVFADCILNISVNDIYVFILMPLTLRTPVSAQPLSPP